jgi:MFS family permease
MSAASETGSRQAALWLMLLAALLTMLNYYDRYVISMVLQDLKGAFALSDGQLGLLAGLGFAMVYSLASLPIARYADRGRHARVLGFSALVWSVMTGLCGLATGFWSLLLARFGVGLGESGGAPTTQALIAQRISRRWQGTAFAVIALAGTFGAFAAHAGGGWIAHHYGWRFVFYSGAVIGVPLALLLLLTVSDRGESGAPAERPHIGFREAIRMLFGRPAFLWLCFGFSVSSLYIYAQAAWMPTYLMRQFGLSSQQVGLSYGTVSGVGMMIGVLVGGIVNDWLNRRDTRAPVFLFIASFGLVGPLAILLLSARDYATVMALAVPLTVVGMIWVSPSFAVIQALSGRRLGATGSAIFNLALNLLGQALGPTLAGWLSDLLTPRFGAESLRYALIILALAFIPGVIACMRAMRTVRQDIATANAD